MNTESTTILIFIGIAVIFFVSVYRITKSTKDDDDTDDFDDINFV